MYIISYHACPGHMLYKRGRSHKNEFTVFIFAVGPHSRDLVILTLRAATFSFYLDEEQMEVLFFVRRV